MVRITKVEFENYRQYKSATVTFPKESKYDLHILRAKNGTGKTTFLNGILWCLYEKEYYLSNKDKALAIVNNSLVQSSEPKTNLKVAVRVTLSSDDETIVFERTQHFFVVENPLSSTNIKKVNPTNSQLKVTITPVDDVSNSVVFEEEADVQGLVKQFFDEAIYDYYFFDGENLKSYFSKEKSERIKSSIFNISQVTLLSNAAAHVKTMAIEKRRSADRIEYKDEATLEDAIQRLEEEIDKLKNENKKIDDQIPELDRVINEADATLQGYSPIRLNIEKRASLDSELRSLQTDYNSFKAEKNVFITTYMTLLNFYPRAKYTLDLIQNKQETGTLPPNIDKEQIEKILSEHAKTCPVCNGDLDEKAIVHLQHLLDELDVSSATSNYLMEIKGGLETVVSRCQKFPEEYEKITKNDKYYIDAIKTKQEEINNISAFLSQYSDENGTLDVKKIENDRKRAIQDKSSLEQRKALNISDIERKRTELQNKLGDRSKIEDKKQKKDLLSRQVSTLRSLCSQYENVQTAIMDEIRSEIQRRTWERFSSMIWKKNTFGSISINDQYELTVFNMNNSQMTGSLSATEYMALAYSFTLAIHDASGKNCPLVVDSPLGRVSDENREKMAAELMKVSENKQIIMLFTPDEYSSEVKKIYNNSAASIRDITLSDSEDQIERIGDINA